MSANDSIFGRPMSRSEYAEQWGNTASAFKNNGHYAWMCGELGAASRVLEIGCGTGVSTGALAEQPGRTILSVESNPSMLARARNYIEDKGVSVRLATLEDCADFSSWPETRVHLLHVDFLSTHLSRVLPSGSFDAIACWLIGSHPDQLAAHMKKPQEAFEGSELAIYRMLVHARSYLLGLSILPIGGIVHTVDRASISSWSFKNEARCNFVESQNKLLPDGFNALSIADCFLRRVPEGFGQSAIRYLALDSRVHPKVAIFTSVKAKRM